MKNLSLNLMGGQLTRSQMRSITGGNEIITPGGGGCTEIKCNWNSTCTANECGSCLATSDPKVAGYCS